MTDLNAALEFEPGCKNIFYIKTKMFSKKGKNGERRKMHLLRRERRTFMKETCLDLQLSCKCKLISRERLIFPTFLSLSEGILTFYPCAGSARQSRVRFVSCASESSSSLSSSALFFCSLLLRHR